LFQVYTVKTLHKDDEDGYYYYYDDDDDDGGDDDYDDYDNDNLPSGHSLFDGLD